MAFFSWKIEIYCPSSGPDALKYARSFLNTEDAKIATQGLNWDHLGAPGALSMGSDVDAALKQVGSVKLPHLLALL